MGKETGYLAKSRFQIEAEALRRRMTPGTSGGKASSWAVSRTLELAAGGRILDLACGNGRHLLELSAGSDRVYAADISGPMLRVARSLVADSPTFRHMTRLDAEQLPFIDKCFGALFCARFFHHLPLPDLRARILSEAFRVSRNGVVITCKAALSWEHLRRRVKSIFRGKKGKLEHYYLWVGEIERVAKEHGWRLTGHFASQPFLAANRVLVMEPEYSTSTETVVQRAWDRPTTSALAES